MNDTMKKVAAVVAAVAALGVAVFAGFKFFAPPALEQGVNHPSPAKSMAQMEKEQMQREDAAAGHGTAAVKDGGADPSANLAGSR